MSKKQTAVQWLQSQYENCPESFLTDDGFNKALQMEREQIEEAFDNGIPFEKGSEYYTQTYGECTQQ